MRNAFFIFWVLLLTAPFIVGLGTPQYIYNPHTGRLDAIMTYNSSDFANQSYVESLLNTTYNYAQTVSVVEGTPSGNLNETWVYNVNSYNISEQASNPALDVRFNFTNVTTMNSMLFRYKNDGTHVIYLSLWDYDDNLWENYGVVGTVNDWTIFTFPILDPESHIDGGVVQMRVYIDSTGIISHNHYFDLIALTSGPAIPSSSEADPYAVHKDGSTNLNNVTGLYICSNITDVIMTTNYTYALEVCT